jgi:hypothetical protein
LSTAARARAELLSWDAVVDDFVADLTAAIEKKDPVANKADAKLPSFAKGGSDAVLNKFEIWQAMPEGKAKNAFLHAHAQEINDCAK